MGLWSLSRVGQVARSALCHRSFVPKTIATESLSFSVHHCLRAFSTSAVLQPIVAANLSVRTTEAPNKLPRLEDLAFGKTFSDHMLIVEWSAKHGWDDPVIKPVEPLPLHPGAQVLHYGMECFEGMKAYIGVDDNIRLFRPGMNMARLARSAARMNLPDFDQDQVLHCLKELLKVDRAWIPKKEGYSLYLRPTVIATTPYLGVGPPANAMLYVITSPVGPYFPTGLVPISLFLDESNVRAWPGGVGDAKVGGNYAATIVPQVSAAQAHGCAQVLYTLPLGEGDENVFVSESGAMNLFFLLTKTDGTEELVSPPLDGTILPGVTRDSILTLCREWGMEVNERGLSLAELKLAHREGRLKEVFGSGTACVIQPVNSLKRADGTVLDIPFDVSSESTLIAKLLKGIKEIQYGVVEHPWSVVVG